MTRVFRLQKVMIVCAKVAASSYIVNDAFPLGPWFAQTAFLNNLPREDSDRHLA